MDQKTKYNQPTNHLHSTEKKWFAVYTKYKTEKFVVEKLTKKGVSAYVPLISYTKKYNRKIKEYQVPLINCYVFVCITKEEYIKVLESEYVKGFLRVGKNLISIPNREISLIKKIVGESEQILAEPSAYEEGSPVEVISGNLTGLKGTLVTINGKNDFVVILETLGYQLKININPKLLRPLSTVALAV